MARVQKIESDSSFANSNILQGTVLVYKTIENGTIKQKAKLPNGNVVEIPPQTDLSNYYTKEEINSILSDSYYTKAEVYNKNEVDTLLSNLSNSFSLSDYYTKEEINSILSDSYYTKAEVYNKNEVDTLLSNLSNSFSLSDYYTKEETQNKLTQLSQGLMFYTVI